MPEYSQDTSSDIPLRIRDLEEKIRLVKDRTFLIGKTFVEEREKNAKEILELKKTISIIKEENSRLKEIIQNITEQVNNSARREEILIIQRQLDLLRKA